MDPEAAPKDDAKICEHYTQINGAPVFEPNCVLLKTFIYVFVWFYKVGILTLKLKDQKRDEKGERLHDFYV